MPVSSNDIVVELAQGGISLIEPLAQEWHELFDRAPGGEPYSRPEWILAYLRAYSPRASMTVLTVRQQGRLQGVLPFVAQSKLISATPGRSLRVPLAMPGGRSHFLLSREVPHDDAVRIAWGKLKTLTGWDVLEFPSVYEGDATEQFFRLAEEEGYHSKSSGLPPVPYVDLGGLTPADLEKLPLNSGRRKHLRQAERKLNAMGQLRFRTIGEANPEDLQRFYDLEASGWKGRENSAIRSSPSSRAFFNDVARESASRGSFSLNLLELDGKVLAAQFGVTCQDRYYAPKVAYDEGYAAYSPGHLIVREILRWCSTNEIREYSMGVREEWKMAWTNNARTRTFRRIYNRTTRARVLFTLRSRVAPSLKKLLRPKAGPD